MSTSEHTIAASLPPLSCVSQFSASRGWRSTYSSRVTRFSVLAQLCITLMPVAVEPVKLTFCTPGWAVSQGPRLSLPLRAWTTPGGKNCCASSTSLRPQYGVKGLERVSLFRHEKNEYERRLDDDGVAGDQGRAEFEHGWISSGVGTAGRFSDTNQEARGLAKSASSREYEA